MNELTTEIKTHVVKFKDTDECVYVTDEMAKKLSFFRRSPNSVSFPLINPSTGRLIRDIGKYEIASISEIKKEALSSPVKVMRWICDCGKKNFMHVWPPNQCECKGGRIEWLKRMIAEQRNLPKAGNLINKS